MTASGPARSSSGGACFAPAPGRSLNRLAYVDALRVVLIMLVVAHHSVEAYVKAHPPVPFTCSDLV